MFKVYEWQSQHNQIRLGGTPRPMVGGLPLREGLALAVLAPYNSVRVEVGSAD
jgi:hypothetical protein